MAVAIRVVALLSGAIRVVGLSAAAEPNLVLLQVSSERLLGDVDSGEVPAGARKAAQFDVAAAGKPFDSPQCKKAREVAGKQAWTVVGKNGPDVLQVLDDDLEWRQDIYFGALDASLDEHGVWQPPNETCPYVAYVRNQKVASRYLCGATAQIFKVRPMTSFRAAYAKPTKFPSDLKTYGNATVHFNPKNPLFTYTVVRDPLQTIIAGYMEITVTRASGFEHVDARYTDFLEMPCSNQKEATARFKSFLKTIRDHGVREDDHKYYPRANMGKEMFHVYPQALKLSVRLEGRTKTFDAVGRLENFAEDMQAIRKLAVGLDDGELPAGSETSTHSHQEESCANIDLEDEDMLHSFCELYHADYVCFDSYEVPNACKGMFN